MRFRLCSPLCAAVVLLANTCPAQAQKASHPLIPGFERFHTNDAGRAGRVLLGELNCIACHQADKEQERAIPRKQAPVLDGVGSRVRVSYLRSFLADPQAAKPGTTMPHMPLGATPQETRDNVEAFVHFLASTGTVKDTRPSPKSVGNGQRLYLQVGCVACHGPHGGKLKEEAAIVPLGELSKKYSIIGLSAFLQDPHKVRPSGRMPSLLLTSQEAQDIAHYLLSDIKVAGGDQNVLYTYYESNAGWGNLPDFARLKPKAGGLAVGFDLHHARRQNNVAMKFDGFLKIDQEGPYTFHLTSDDGAKLWIDDQVVVNNDGVHPPTLKSAGTKLTRGMHPLTVAVFNAGGGFELDVDFEGPGIPRQPLAPHVYPKPEITPKPPAKPSPDVLVLDPDLVKRGRSLFASECAACHTLNEGGKPIAWSRKAPPLSRLPAARGCQAKDAPQYHLTQAQGAALNAALAGLDKLAKPPTAGETIAHTMTVFNCYACHQRDKIGGVESGLNDLFQTTQKEMGDEGRIPTNLDGVGAKLTVAYMKKVLANGATDRPYMLTRMPKFGESNVGHLQAAFEEADPVLTVPIPTFSVPEKRVKSEGRHIVGNKALGCIKCHNFREHKSGGVQGINMTIMTERVRRDWFLRYLLDPNKFRPGTRMPAAWPLGQSQLPKILGGDTAQQVEAVWLYLSDGPKAANPYGVGREPILLAADNGEAILYRNFIQGAGPRAIGVGYPEKVNLAFDAGDLRYALLWHKEFMDASRHWTDRGAGFEPPLGEGILTLPPGPDCAFLANPDAPWPAKADPDKGYRFKGYRLDDKQRPTFLYEVNGTRIEDQMLPVETKEGAHFKRTLTVTGESENLYFRVASSSAIKDLGKGWFAVGNDLKVRVEAPALVRTQAGKMELLVPIRDKKSKIVVEMLW